MARIEGTDRARAVASVGPGWRGLVEGAYDAYGALDDGLVVHVQQVKEKFAELRIYAYARLVGEDGEAAKVGEGDRTAVRAIADEATWRSLVTCEVCGRAGEMGGTSWLKTQCGWHGYLRDARGVRSWGYLAREVGEEAVAEALDRAARIEGELAFAEADARALTDAVGAMERTPVGVRTPEDYLDALEGYRRLVAAARGEEGAVRTLAAREPEVLLRAIERSLDDRTLAPEERLGRGHEVPVRPRIDPRSLAPDDLRPLLEHDEASVRERAVQWVGVVGRSVDPAGEDRRVR